MIKNPLISVIMPVYNGEKFLRQSIDSILNQTIKDFELIIINDGSTDNTENIILSYDDDRVKYIKNESNLKLIKTLNKGLNIATGKYISRMDADDIAVNTLFEKQLDAFNNDKTVGIVNICTYELSENGEFYRKSLRPILFHNCILKYVLLFQNQITHPGIMVKSELIKKYKYKDDGTVYNFEDVDLWIRMTWDGIKCITLCDRLLFYRINNNGVTRLYGNKRNILRVKYCADFIKNKLNIDIQEEFLYLFYADVSNHPYKQTYIDKLIIKICYYIRNSDDKNFINEFISWYKLRMMVVNIQILKSESFRNKLKAIYNICTHLSWFINKPFIIFVKDTFKNNWIKHEDCNVW